MATFNVPMTVSANVTVTVETDETDPEKIADLALDQVGVSLCHQCAGERNDSLDIGDDFSTVLGDGGIPEVYKTSD